MGNLHLDIVFFVASGVLFIDAFLSNRWSKTVLGYIALGLGYYFLMKG